MKLKILSWNVWFRGNLEKVNEFLVHSNADILCLQEIMMFDKKIELSKQFMEKRGYKHVFATSFQHPVNGTLTNIGNAIFSKFPIQNSKVHNLSKSENRVALQADLQIGTDMLHVFNTHLLHTHQRPSELQTLQVSNLARALTLKKTILMGDFNALPESSTIKIISNVLENTDTRNLPTWSMYPDGCETCLPKHVMHKLDYIFVSSDIKSSDFKVEQSHASDHLPISVTIEI